YGYQAVHERWLRMHLKDGVVIQNVSDRRTGFQIAGPLARAVLAEATRADVSADAFSFMDVKRMTVGMCDCIVQRLSYTGDLGYEIYTDAMDQRALWDTLWAAGQQHGMRPFGMRAMMSLRLDKFFGSWLSEFSPDYTPAETGMDRFVAFDKEADFIGRSAAEAERQAGAKRKLVVFEVDADDADAVGYEPVWIDGEVKGFCTSGGYSHYAKKSIALALVDGESLSDELEADIEILGDMRGAKRIHPMYFDADGQRMRG
ncbi:MAG: aminomethyltransferase family protein, partial [Arenicellales bacterium]|nr:aminomethyltransferase family protein [Arenicellales bacterium]